MEQLNAAQEILAVSTHGMSFNLGAYTVTLNNPAASGNCFTADVIVEKAGVIVFNDDAKVINPPLLVPDENGDIVRGGNTVTNSITREDVTLPVERFRRDPLAALKAVIQQTILGRVQ